MIYSNFVPTIKNMCISHVQMNMSFLFYRLSLKKFSQPRKTLSLGFVMVTKLCLLQPSLLAISITLIDQVIYLTNFQLFS
jgi:hypothetical protein